MFRFADYVIDLAPHMTFATEHAIPAALIALWGVYSGADIEEEEEIEDDIRNDEEKIETNNE